MGDPGLLGGARCAAVRHLLEPTSCRIEHKRPDAWDSLRGSPAPSRRPGNLAATSLFLSALRCQDSRSTPVGSGLSLWGKGPGAGKCSPPVSVRGPTARALRAVAPSSS